MNIQEIIKWTGEKTCGRPFINDFITVEFNNRMTSCAGRAIWDYSTKCGKIILSTPLWERASEEQRRNTVVHETCHIIKCFLYGRTDSAHGRKWKQLMAFCGYTGQIRCHNIDRTGLTQTFEAYCECQTHRISKHLCTKMLNGHIYKCNCCGKRIYLGKLQESLAI